MMARQRSVIEKGFAPVDGVSLYFERIGSGPAVVFLHGNPADHRMWDAQVDDFSARYTVVRYDLRGFGRSIPVDRRPYAHATDLHALLRFLGISDPLLVGLSMGGGAIVNFAIAYPGIARAIVPVDSSLGGFSYSADLIAELTSLALVSQRNGLDAAREHLLSQSLFRAAMSDPRTADALRTIVGAYGGWHWTGKDPGVPFTPPAIARLATIAVPTLVLVGEHDVPDFHEISRTLARDIPAARLTVIPRVGHIPNMEDPAAFNALVLAFFDEVTARSPVRPEGILP